MGSNRTRGFALAQVSTCVLLVVGVSGCGLIRRLADQSGVVGQRKTNCPKVPSKYDIEQKYVRPSAAERDRKGLDWSGGVNTEPTLRYRAFSKLEKTFAAPASRDCGARRHKRFASTKTTFAEEWAYQQRREAARVVALEGRADAKRRVAAEKARRREDLVAAAKKMGYRDILFDVGLAEAISRLVRGETRLEHLKNTLIELIDFRDRYFKAMQVLGPNKVIYTTSRSDSVVMLRRYGETVLQGSALTTLQGNYVVITGTTSYNTLVGSRQAIVIEMARRK